MKKDGGGGSCASQFEDHDMDQLLALHHTDPTSRPHPRTASVPPSMQTTQLSLFMRASSCYSTFYPQASMEMLMLMKEREGYLSVLRKLSRMQSPKAKYLPQNMLGSELLSTKQHVQMTVLTSSTRLALCKVHSSSTVGHNHVKACAR